MHQVNSIKQDGSVLLEALIAILIFSMGILAIVGLQAASVQASSEAKYRTEASLLANQLIGQMWVGNRSPAALQAAFSSTANGASYQAWAGNVATTGTVLGTLPGGIAPTVTIVTTTGTTPTSLVTITIFWKAPSEPTANPPHRYVTMAQIV